MKEPFNTRTDARVYTHRSQWFDRNDLSWFEFIKTITFFNKVLHSATYMEYQQNFCQNHSSVTIYTDGVGIPNDENIF